MDSHNNTVSLKDIEKFCSRVGDPESDTISDSELWAVMSQKQLREQLDRCDENLKSMEQKFHDLALKSNGSCDQQSGNGFPEETLALNQRSLRKFKAKQSDRTRLYDYLQRRIIKNNMEDLFGERGYENFQRLIFVLIFGVLGVLVIEYTYFNDVLEDVNQSVAIKKEHKEAKNLGFPYFSYYLEAVEYAKLNAKPVEDAKAQEQRLRQQKKKISLKKGELTVDESIKRATDTIEAKLTEAKPLGIFKLSLFTIAIFDVAVCIIFLFEYFLRLHFSEDRKWYFLNHKIDLVSSIPMSGIIILSGGLIPGDFMVLRAIRLFRIFRAMRIASFFWRGMERLEQVANVKLMRQSFMMFILLAFLGGFMIQMVEQVSEPEVQKVETVKDSDTRDDESYVTDRGKSFWWAVTSLTSGGFGDLYRPKTTPGWVLVTLLVVSGIVVVGVFTATLTTIFKREDSEDMLHQQMEIQDDVSEILNNVRESSKQVEAIQHELQDLKQKYSTLQSQVGMIARKELEDEHS